VSFDPTVFAITPDMAVTVTPELAAAWLERNTGNRSLKPAKIAEYAEAMQRGEWDLTGEGVRFSSSGRLIDGQNRLHAVIRSGVSIRTFVFVGLADAAQMVMDSGTKRTPGDALQFAGYKSANHLAAVARSVIAYDTGALRATAGGGKPLTGPQAVAWANENHEDAYSALALARELPRIKSISTSMLAAAILILRRVDSEEADLFFKEVNERLVTSVGSPALVLSDRLDKAEANRETLRLSHYLCMIFRAWNAWRMGDTIQRLQAVKAGRALPIPDPF